ncbi:MAG: putative molybdenum carrier protein [Rhizonema sp. PD38]|nr:putative molybdenum carrier protein [Rhizonema sp. PD38]
MTIQAKHFDTRLNQWIHIDGNTNNHDSLLKEELNNTLLEYFLTEVNFSFGHMDEKSTALQLTNHPDGHKLLLSSKTRLLYGPSECLDTIKQLCPDNKDRGAYGSIFLGACENAVNRELNILIVDDSDGENGGIINNDQAYRLTGDCYGQISTELYHELTNHIEGNKYRVIQHRFGWTDQDGDDTKYRFGKGTLRPANLDQILNHQDPNNQTKVDLILPISAFKGTDKDNPNGPTKPQIQPGLYQQNIWLGEKSQSELGRTAISQLLASFPNGVKDFTEQLELEAKRLKDSQDDPRQLAQLYCEKYEKRKAFLEELATALEEETFSDPTVTEELETLRNRLTNDSFIYKLIKADLLGQLLETEKVQRELARFVQNEWKEIAIGKTLTFERAVVIPSKDLQNGEISIPHYQDSEQVLNFRSPFLNSNGLCISTNKVVEDILGPDGKPLAGVIAVSDETSDRIYNRLNEQILSILTEAQEKSLQLEGIENYLDKNIGKLETSDKIEFTNKFNQYITELQSAGYELEILPQESEQERQARDYDGDCIGFEQACNYPNLTAEALERNLPENAYDPTVKLKKQSFYQEDGSQPEFEEIAIHMSDGISVGIINNHLTSIEALESEITILKTFGSEKDQIDYVQQVAKHYEDLFKTEAWAKSKGIEGKEIPDKYRASLEEFVQNARQPLDLEAALKAMSVNTKMYREMIASAAFQNQIAVDLFKSAKKPEMEIIRSNSRILHREVNYIKDKKKDVYVDETIKPTGYSPVELLIAKTNQYFEKARLESRELFQFQDLFNSVEFSQGKRLQCTVAKKEFDELFSLATQLSRQKETEKGPAANITLANGNQVSVTNLLRYDNEFIWKANKITIKLSEVPEEKRNISRPHKYVVYAQINDETENGSPKFRALGTQALEQENKLQEIGITSGQEVTSNKISFQPELSEGQIKLLYQKAYQAAEEFYNSIPENQKLAMAAATWAVSTTKESSSEKNTDNQRKVSNFAFAAFPQEIISQLDTLKFTEFSITGFERSIEVFNENQLQNVRFNLAENGKSVIEIQNQDGNYETFGNIDQNNARLPIGTIATTDIAKTEVYTASVTTKVPGLPELTFKVGEVNKFGNNFQKFHNESVTLTIEKVDLIREDYVIYIQNSNKQEKLGNIDKESVKEGVAQGWLAEKPGNGQQLQLKIKTITTGQNAYAVAETTEGHLLRINITHQKYKKQEITDREFRETSVRAFDKKHVYIAKIGERALGIIGQHNERLEAELNKGNAQIQWQRKESSTVQKLIDTGIIRSYQQRTTIPVQITSNESTCKITINPETVQYPDQWIKRSQLISNEQPIRNEEQEKSNQILSKINERPTIMFQDSEQKLVGLVGLTVDENIAQRTKKYLEKVGVSYEQLPPTQARLEAKKGMTVFMLDENTISVPIRIRQRFIERAGGNIKSAVAPSQTVPIILEQTVYFYNQNQQYSSVDGSQVETKEAIGIVVPAQDAIAVTNWFESLSVDSNYFIENNTATFIITKSEISEEISQELNALLGEAINIGEVDGFDRYEELSAELNQKLETQNSLLPSNRTSLDSEYFQALKALPNRPKELSQSETPVPIVTAKPIEIEQAPTKTLTTDVKINSQNNPQQWEWARYALQGKANYEVSSAGDGRFSALNAKLSDGRTIEEAYQLDVKGYRSSPDDKNWRKGKGKPPRTPMPGGQLYQEYKKLWQQWVQENPNLINELALKSQGLVLTDKFASTNISQARALAEILTERIALKAQQLQNPTVQGGDINPIQLPSSKQADPTKAIEVLGKVSADKVVALRSHLETNFKPLLENDKSNYSPGRQVAWVGAKWDLKDKDFKPGVQDDALMQLVKQVYSDADIVLVTYSAQAGAGINYHRDDSYAATEARSINIGNSEWGYRAAKEQMVWTKGENTAATYQEFKLESGTVTRFNCKNEHAAINTEAGRWSINIWSVKDDLGKENSVRQKFENFLASNQPNHAVVQSNTDLTIKSNEWVPGGEIKVERSYANIEDTTRNTLSRPSNQPTIEQIIAIGNSTAARAANPQIPENPTISGKPVPMVFSLHMHGEPHKVPVNTTIDAMRGHGRVHTTRGVDYQKTYGIKEGDIAIAVGKNGELVAILVGKQYEITPQMIQNPDYQQAWANWEKHSSQELTQTQASKSKVYGLFMEPLGDYVNGNIVPFSPVQKQTAASLHISPDSKDGLLAALANATALAKEQGKLQNDYQVSFNNNPEAAAGQYGVETHLQKPLGVAYASAEHAFNHQKHLNPSIDEYKLMVEVLQAKLEQHPRIIDAISIRGGTEWLENSTTITNTQDKLWEGKGKESAFIRAIALAYNNVVKKSQQANVSVAPTNIEIKADVKTQPVKVISGGQTGADMGGLIGAKTLGLATGGTAAAGWMTENGANPNLQEYGLVEGKKGNTAAETYNKRTIENIRNSDGTAIFGNVNSPGSRFTVQAAQNLGKPVLHVPLDTALNNRPAAAQQLRDFVETNNIKILNVAGNRESKAPGLQAAVTEIVQIGLAYQQNKENTRNSPAAVDTASPEKPVATSNIASLKVQNVIETSQVQEQSPPNPRTVEPRQHNQQPDIQQALASPSQLRTQQVGAMDGILTRIRANTVQNLQDWYVAAGKLGKSERYLSRIQEVTDLYIKENIGLENAFKAMERDIEELEKINEMTSLTQHVVKTIGQEDSNGIMSVQTEKYQIATKAQNQTYLVKDKDDNVLLYVKEGKTQVNNIKDEILQDFRAMSLRIDNALNYVKKDLIER